jgi:hypothetical protein
MKPIVCQSGLTIICVCVLKVFLVDNASSDNTTDIMQPHIVLDLVGLRTHVGLHSQLAVNNTVLPMLRNETFRVALTRHEVRVYVQWGRYNSNRKEEKEVGPDKERFRAHARWNQRPNRLRKSISQLREVLGAHVANIRHQSGTAVNPCRNKC